MATAPHLLKMGRALVAFVCPLTSETGLGGDGASVAVLASLIFAVNAS